ncbi:MAG: hypothetical protein ACLP59_31530 [Bryobacteraceae bacterium]
MRGRNASPNKGFSNLPGHLIHPRAGLASVPANILDRHLDEQHSQRLKMGWKAFDNLSDVETEMQCIHHARGRALIENVQRVGVAGILSIHQIVTENFRRPPAFAHDKYGGVIAHHATHETLPVAARRIELWRAAKAV